jgi:hypothetical protein
VSILKQCLWMRPKAVLKVQLMLIAIASLEKSGPGWFAAGQVAQTRSLNRVANPLIACWWSGFASIAAQPATILRSK